MEEASEGGLFSFVFEKRVRHCGKNPEKVVYGHVVIFLIALQQFFLQLLYGTKSGHQEKAPPGPYIAATLINVLFSSPL